VELPNTHVVNFGNAKGKHLTFSQYHKKMPAVRFVTQAHRPLKNSCSKKVIAQTGRRKKEKALFLAAAAPTLKCVQWRGINNEIKKGLCLGKGACTRVCSSPRRERVLTGRLKWAIME